MLEFYDGLCVSLHPLECKYNCATQIMAVGVPNRKAEEIQSSALISKKVQIANWSWTLLKFERWLVPL